VSEVDSAAIGVEREFPGFSFAIAISHSCDIVSDNLDAEPEVELAAARFVEEANPNFTHAKNTRILHLAVSDAGKPRFAEICASKKMRIPKRELAPFEPDQRCQVASSELFELQDWLASRYKRAAFPDQLNDLLGRIEKTLEAIGKGAPRAILAVYVEYEPETPVLEQGELYEVRIHIVYSTEIANAQTAAEDAAERLSARFQKQFMKNGKWNCLELRDCRAISEAAFTYYDMARMKKYRLDHISLKQSPPEDPDVE